MVDPELSVTPRGVALGVACVATICFFASTIEGCAAAPIKRRPRAHPPRVTVALSNAPGSSINVPPTYNEDPGAFATAEPTEQRTHEQLTVARACWVEASFNLRDCAAIAYVLQSSAKRLGKSLTDRAFEYSALKASTPRAEIARMLPDGDEPTFSASENRKWADVRRTAADALAGRVKNPTPGAKHWGARDLDNDVSRAQRAIDAGKWLAIDSDTANAFYRSARRSVSARVARGTYQ